MPRAPSSSMVVIRSFNDRPSRSSFQTRRQSNFLCRASAIISVKAGGGCWRRCSRDRCILCGLPSGGAFDVLAELGELQIGVLTVSGDSGVDGNIFHCAKNPLDFGGFEGLLGMGWVGKMDCGGFQALQFGGQEDKSFSELEKRGSS